MHAINLFDGTAVVEEPPRARRRDPDTSKQAAAAASQFTGKHQEMILQAMKGRGECGAEQIAAWTKIDAYQCRKRLPEAEALGLVRVVLEKNGDPKTRKTVSGRSERLWVLVTA